MPVPFIDSEFVEVPERLVSPQTMAQIIGSVVLTRKMPLPGNVGSFS
jgi:hypothetical protein